MGNAELKRTLDKLRADLRAIEEQEKEVGKKKAELIRAIAALAPLCGEKSPIASMSLANAIRTVILTFRKPMRPVEIRKELVEMGYDLSAYNNPLASIHTALKRMEESGELIDYDRLRSKVKDVPSGDTSTA